VPRAKLSELRGYLTTSSVADALGLSPYLVKARITDGTLPEATNVSEAGVLLFDDEWLSGARDLLAVGPRRRRRRGSRANGSIPTPERVLGHTMGEAGWLPEWDDIIRYFTELDAVSDRVHLETLGTSTSGKPYIAVYISAPENLQPSSLERNRELLGQLWDPRGMNREETDLLIAEARSVAVILATQHSNEIGAALMTLDLAYELVTKDDKETQAILSNTITVLIPSHNPDGLQMISEWYARWLGTEYEGVDLPWLCHPYTGHDNNRDWFMMTQAETRLYVDLHNREHPQAVFDMHQMGRKGVRFMVPPFIDPLDPNQDPLIQQGFAALGSHIAQRLTAENKAGVATNAIFDNYSPSLAYGNYHGSVDLLSEAASVKLATSVTLGEDDLEAEHGFDPRERAWNHPLPWKGGEWTLADIIEYDRVAARAFLHHLSAFREQWLRDYMGIACRVVDRSEKPYAFVIPREQRDDAATVELLQILQRGLVEVQVATAPFEADGITFGAGSHIVRLDQPAGSFAKTLLETQEYPDLREWPGGPPRKPYDIVGHTLPIQMGVQAVQIDRPLGGDLPADLLDPIERLTGEVAGVVTDVTGWTIDPRSNASIAAIQELHEQAIPFYRTRKTDGGLAVGTIVVPNVAGREVAIAAVVEKTGATATGIDFACPIDAWLQAPVRLGVYQPWTASMDEGWARWVLEEYNVPYTTLQTSDVRQGGLRDRFDVLLIPHMSAKDLRDGRPEKGRYKDLMPPEYVGGLGDVGLEALRRFASDGGTLIGIDGVAQGLIEALSLPVRNALSKLKDDEFYCPGSLLKVVFDTKDPLGYGFARETPVLFLESVAFESLGAEAKVVGQYPASNPNLSGWILGSEHLERKAALVDIAFGDGRVILFGFRPYFRAQTRVTYKVFFNAIARAGLREEALVLSNVGA